jgi:multisubunit Na+/H+ antiporter MnhB subunit
MNGSVGRGDRRARWLGTGVLVVSLLLFLTGLSAPGAAGNRMAIALVLLLVALPLLYPTMLREGRAVSTMRAIVYLVVGLFAVLTIRVGWGASTIADIKIDPWWATIISAAIGGKAVQSLGEANVPAGAERPTTPPPLPPRRPAT